MWHHHFSDLLKSVHNTDSKSFVSEHIDDILPKITISISTGDARDILKELRMGKCVLVRIYLVLRRNMQLIYAYIQ